MTKGARNLNRNVVGNFGRGAFDCAKRGFDFSLPTGERRAAVKLTFDGLFLTTDHRVADPREVSWMGRRIELR